MAWSYQPGEPRTAWHPFLEIHTHSDQAKRIPGPFIKRQTKPGRPGFLPNALGSKGVAGSLAQYAKKNGHT